MKLVLAALLLVLHARSQSVPPSNLPPSVTENEDDAVFAASASKLLSNTTIDEAWSILIDFEAYPEWNPFVRSQVLTDEFFIPLPSQSSSGIAANGRLKIQVQIPPLALPVSASTPPNLLHVQSSLENITYFNPSEHRMAWKQIMLPDDVLMSTRWTALSEFEGQVYYETYEAYFGPLAYTVKALFEDGLQAGFEAQAEGLQLRLNPET